MEYVERLDAKGPEAEEPEAEGPIDVEAIAELLAILPLLEAGQPLYQLHPSLGSPGFNPFPDSAHAHTSPYVYSPELRRWRCAVEQGPVPLRFDWPQWLDSAQALDASLALIAQADLLTLRKLLTTYLRTERFTGGTLARIVEQGQLGCILRRVSVLCKATG